MVKPEELNLLFDSLVGTSEASDVFEGRLTESVRRTIASGHPPTSAYWTLESTANEAIRLTVDDSMASSVDNDPLRLEIFKKNGYTGSKVAVGALRSLGGVYEERAKLPQRRANVERGVRLFLGRVYGIAGYENSTATYSLEAHRLGLNPREWDNFDIIQASSEANIIQEVNLDGAFDITTDVNGQLKFRSKFGLLPRAENEAGCPAINVKVVDGEGKVKSGLMMFMTVLGTIAINEIYTQQFRFAQERTI